MCFPHMHKHLFRLPAAAWRVLRVQQTEKKKMPDSLVAHGQLPMGGEMHRTNAATDVVLLRRCTFLCGGSFRCCSGCGGQCSGLSHEESQPDLSAAPLSRVLNNRFCRVFVFPFFVFRLFKEKNPCLFPAGFTASNPRHPTTAISFHHTITPRATVSHTQSKERSWQREPARERSNSTKAGSRFERESTHWRQLWLKGG